MVVQAAATIALGLLGVAGIAKVADPQPTVAALTAARLPSHLWLVRALGLLEFGAAVAALALGSVAAAPAALLYVGFAIFTWSALRGNLPLQSCGCFGREDTPPSWIHFGFNMVSALALASVVIWEGTTFAWSAPGDLVLGYLAFSGLGVYAAYLMLTSLPQTLAASSR